MSRLLWPTRNLDRYSSVMSLHTYITPCESHDVTHIDESMNNNIFQICFARINHRCIWNHKMQKQMCNVSLHIFGYHLCHWVWCCMYYCWCLAWWWVRYSWWVGCHTKIRISPIIGALNPHVKFVNTQKRALDKDSIGNTLFQEVCNTRTNPDDPTETLKTVGQNVESNEVTDVDSFLDAAKSKSSALNRLASTERFSRYQTV